MKALSLVSNYAVTEDTARAAVLNNKTAPIDQEEIISFRSKDLPNINHSLVIQNPAKVDAAMQYGVQIEEVLTTTDSDDPSFRVDEPIVITATVRHPKSGNFTNSIVAQAFVRMISSLVRADGSWRFDDLMRSAERPAAN
jgi:hypothetical protein